MAFRAPTPLIALLLLCCVEYDAEPRDTAAPPEADSDTDTDSDSDPDTDSDAEPATAQGLCETVFALCEDDWGWNDADSCAESWLGEGEDWECSDIPGYLNCAAPCLDAADCEAFGACEVPCWDEHCL